MGYSSEFLSQKRCIMIIIIIVHFYSTAMQLDPTSIPSAAIVDVAMRKELSRLPSAEPETFAHVNPFHLIIQSIYASFAPITKFELVKETTTTTKYSNER